MSERYLVGNLAHENELDLFTTVIQIGNLLLFFENCIVKVKQIKTNYYQWYATTNDGYQY